MRKLALLSLLAVGVMVLSACAGPAPAVEPTAQPESTAPPPPDPTAAPTEVAATQIQPAQPPPVEGPTRVEITLADNTIASNLTSFKAGAAYTFVISNNGRHEHNFNIAPPVAVAGGYGEALAQALLAVDETQIPPGSSTTVEFAFPDSAVGGDLEFSCLIRRHYEDGMRLDITVSS
jgi:uncharacterized cupredoxin-like copper-binding protein